MIEVVRLAEEIGVVGGQHVERLLQLAVAVSGARRSWQAPGRPSAGGERAQVVQQAAADHTVIVGLYERLLACSLPRSEAISSKRAMEKGGDHAYRRGCMR